jgi:hypothetical protein
MVARPEIETNGSELLVKLSTALALISKGDPIVSLRTELATQFDAIQTRFTAIDKATELQHDDLVRVPTQVDKAVSALEGKQEVRFKAIEDSARIIHEDYVRVPTLLDRAMDEQRSLMQEKIDGVKHVFDERFARIDGAFVELNRQTTVLRSTDQLALAAALQTAEKAVNKTELNTAESIKALRLAFDDANKATNAKIDAVTSRLDKGEGVSRGSVDIAASQRDIQRDIMAAQSVQHGGYQNWLALAALALAAAGWIYTATRAPLAPAVVYSQPEGVLRADPTRPQHQSFPLSPTWDSSRPL